MSNLQVSRSHSLSSVTPKASSPVSAPAAPVRTASVPSLPSVTAKPSAFKSTGSAPAESQQLESLIQKTSASSIRQTEKLLDPQLKSTILSDLKPQTLSTPGTASSAGTTSPVDTRALDASNLFAKSLTSLQDKLRPQATEVPVDAQGNLTNDANPMDVLLMRYNPLADKAAKKESEAFRAFAKSELSSENFGFLDDSVKLSRLSPQSKEFDVHLDHVYNNYIKEGGQATINISSQERTRSAQSYRSLLAARTAHDREPSPATEASLFQARAEVMDAMARNVGSINGLMKDTWSRYTNDNHSTFRQDVMQNQKATPFNLINTRLAQETRDHELAASAKNPERGKPGAIQRKVRERLQNKQKHGQIYRDYKNTLKDPEWPARQERIRAHRRKVIQQKERASGARQGTLKFGLYETFIAPWKSWG